MRISSPILRHQKQLELIPHPVTFQFQQAQDLKGSETMSTQPLNPNPVLNLYPALSFTFFNTFFLFAVFFLTVSLFLFF